MVLHHAVIPYTYFGHTDAKSWIGFDFVVTATDSFFMAMFFFLSGLFVWPSLSHKSTAAHLRDRLLRLGLPFAIAAVTVIPLAYYAIALRQRSRSDLRGLLVENGHGRAVAERPDLVRLGAVRLRSAGDRAVQAISELIDPINRLSEQCLNRPARFFLFLLAVTAIVYVPALIYFGPNRWFEFGPFSVQASRILLYAAYFFIGAGVGVAHLNQGVLSADGRLAKSSWGWMVATLVPYCPDVGDDLHQA